MEGTFPEEALLDILLAQETVAATELTTVVRRMLANLREGHTCLPLEMLAADPESGPPERIRDLLAGSGLVGAPGHWRPLILDEGRLYPYRYWYYEQQLAARLVALAQDVPTVCETRLAEGLCRYFGAPAATTDWQRVAAAVAVLRRLVIICGGPGTGKTTTVVRILALLLEQAGSSPFEIALAAPTGKAAARMQEAIVRALGALPADPQVKARIPSEAATLHRLLGLNPQTGRFRYHRSHPLPHDLVIVDEASMVDLALMYRLLDAIKPGGRLILLGDKDQLASVEVGAVLGDLCARVSLSTAFAERIMGLCGQTLRNVPFPGTPLADSVVMLTHSHRFQEGGAIGRLAQAVNHGAVEDALLRLEGGGEALIWQEGAAAGHRAGVVAGFRPYLEQLRAGAPLQEVLRAFDRFRILCAHREGQAGVEGLNAWVEAELASSGLLRRRGSPWYPGRPLMISRNDPGLRLYNGDIGIIVEVEGRPMAAFPDPDGGARLISPARLPPHDTAYAMTIHKSQGSEFDEVLIVLPDRMTPVLNRNLLYTGLTRARRRIVLAAAKDILAATIATACPRHSGLLAALARQQANEENQ